MPKDKTVPSKPIKSKSVLVRVDPGLAKRAQKHADILNIKLATLFRNAVKFYIDDLERNNAEVREVIRGIILTKLDKLARETEQGKLVIFTKIIPVNPAIGCSVCLDEDGNKYIVYEIAMREGEERITAINRFSERLYNEWKTFDSERQNEFIVNLHADHVCFTMQSMIQEGW